MQLPLGYHIKGENLVCKLKRSLYGLRQASRQWFQKFSTTLTSYGFQQSTADYSLFPKGSGSQLIIWLVYVDDIIISSPNASLITSTISQLQNTFKLKLLGDLKYFLGLEIAKSSKGIHLCQRKYTLQLLEDTCFTNSKPSSLLMDPNS